MIKKSINYYAKFHFKYKSLDPTFSVHLVKNISRNSIIIEFRLLAEKLKIED